MNAVIYTNEDRLTATLVELLNKHSIPYTVVNDKSSLIKTKYRVFPTLELTNGGKVTSYNFVEAVNFLLGL